MKQATEQSSFVWWRRVNYWNDPKAGELSKDVLIGPNKFILREMEGEMGAKKNAIR